MMKKIFSSIINFLFSPRCPFCGDSVAEDELCYDCFLNLDFLTICCIKCQQPLESFCVDMNICNLCLDGCDFYNQMICAFSYSTFLKNYILRFKNGNMIYLSDFFVKFIYNKARHFLTDNSIIAPISLHSSKLKKRGYNQSLLLAKSFANIANIDCYDDLIIRKKDTTTQAQKTATERIENVKDAFILNENYDIKNKEIFIIDDVITTGATIFEAAKIFKDTKPESIFLLSVGRRIR